MWSGPLSFSQNTCFVCEIAKILGSRLELTSVGKIPAITLSPPRYFGRQFDLRIDNISNRVLLNFQTCVDNSQFK